MNVYEISVRKMQRVQVKDYEPAEAEITIKAQLTEGESYQDAITKLMDEASIGVRAGLGLSSTGKIILERTPVKANPAPAKTHTPSDDFGDEEGAAVNPPVKRRGRPPKAKPVEDDFGDEPKPKAALVEDDFGDEPKPVTKEKPPVEDDFEDAPVKEKPVEVAKPKKRDDAEEDVRTYVMELITGKKISAADVRLIVKEKFNVTTMRDVPDEYLHDLKEAVDLKIEADAV